jgi:RNA polymerase sigma factor (sigma-70 family)
MAFLLSDESGLPLDTRIVSALQVMLPRLRRQFPHLDDDAVVADLLEEAGRRIARWEATNGPAEKLYGFAWTTLRNCAVSHTRRGTSIVEQNSLPAQQSGQLLARQATQTGSPEEIEHAVFLRQVLEQLSSEERWILVRKQAGFSSKDLARELGTHASRIDQIVFRTKAKLRRLLGREGKNP